MDLTADHLGFVFASYGITIVCILGLCLYVLGRDRAMHRRIGEQKEQRGP